MKAYKVNSTNMDLRDGTFDHGYFLELRHAEDILKGYTALHDGKDPIEDLNGSLEEYNGVSFKYSKWHNKPAVYYKSDWGNHNMTVWIETIHIQE